MRHLRALDIIGTLELGGAGHVLEVCCGQNPDRCWLTHAVNYVGVDVSRDIAADIVVAPGAAGLAVDGIANLADEDVIRWRGAPFTVLHRVLLLVEGMSSRAPAYELTAWRLDISRHGV